MMRKRERDRMAGLRPPAEIDGRRRVRVEGVWVGVSRPELSDGIVAPATNVASVENYAAMGAARRDRHRAPPAALHRGRQRIAHLARPITVRRARERAAELEVAVVAPAPGLADVEQRASEVATDGDSR